MIKKISCALLMAVGVLLSVAQQNSTLLKTIATDAFAVSTDQFANVYLVSANKVEKYDKNGKFIARYEEFKYGKIGRLDVSNAMKLTLYFPDFMKVVYLDKFLSTIKEIDLFMLGYQNITAVCSATDGNLWFYDPATLCLKKIDENGTVYRNSQPINIMTEHTISPVFMLEKNGQVYVSDTAKGIMIFDIFATYKKILPLTGVPSFQLFQNQLIYTKENQIAVYQLAELNDNAVQLPAAARVLQSAIEKDRLYVLSDRQLFIYGR